MIINKLPISVNFSKRFNSLSYIVIHDTGNSNHGAGAINHYRYFNGGYRGASAHFFVDESNIVECVDPRLVSWHCGDGKGRYGISNSRVVRHFDASGKICPRSMSGDNWKLWWEFLGRL